MGSLSRAGSWSARTSRTQNVSLVPREWGGVDGSEAQASSALTKCKNTKRASTSWSRTWKPPAGVFITASVSYLFTWGLRPLWDQTAGTPLLCGQGPCSLDSHTLSWGHLSVKPLTGCVTVGDHAAPQYAGPPQVSVSSSRPEACTPRCSEDTNFPLLRWGNPWKPCAEIWFKAEQGSKDPVSPGEGVAHCWASRKKSERRGPGGRLRELLVARNGVDSVAGAHVSKLWLARPQAAAGWWEALGPG